MIHRPRILRQQDTIRQMVAETCLQAQHFIVPLFITEGNNVKEEISSMPNYFRQSIDHTIEEVKLLFDLGIKSVLLFTKVNDNLKSDDCKEALNEAGLMARAIQAIKKDCPQMIVMTDVALDPFSPYGHDGLVRDKQIVNDETVEVLCKMSLMHAKMGANFVAPSDMMDGRIGAIRTHLEKNAYTQTGILAYSAKYASCFYGPFRDALDSAPGFGDKKTYQMDYKNRLEAQKEVALDVQEGADIVMVKPAGAYLDIIREIKNTTQIPLAAYQVSGEYSMIKATAAKGWLHEQAAITESLFAIKRAGADLIATYFAKDFLMK